MLSALLGAAASAAAAPPTGPVFVVHNQAQFDAVMAASDAELSGATIMVSGGLWPTNLQLPGGRAFSPRLSIVGAGGHKLPGLRFGQGLFSGVNLVGLKIQHQNWPATGAVVQFQSITNLTDATFDGCEIWHGYGPSLLPFDEGTVYPEYARIDNVVDVGATPQTVAVTWRAPGDAGGIIQFFNRGTRDVEVRLGATPSAAASATPTVCSPGGSTTGRTALVATPATAAYMHVVCPTAGVGEVVTCNARSEQGLGEYLADAFSSGGAGATTGDVEFRNCHIHDVFNAIKGLAPVRGHLTLFRNRIERCYQDVIAMGFPMATNSRLTVALNDLDMPFCRSGIKETSNGDAGDAHGDVFQTYNTSPGSLPAGSFVVAGNTVMVPANLRSGGGVGNQGGVYCDASAGYADCYVVGNVLFLADGVKNAIWFGSQPRSDRIYIAGNVTFSPEDPIGASGQISIVSSSTERFGRSFVAGNICNVLNFTPTVGLDNVGLVDNHAIRAAMDTYVADLAGIRGASAAGTRAACAGAGAALGRGIDYVASAIDRSAASADAVILWDKLPVGVTFESLAGLASGAVATSEPVKIFGGGTAMPITITGGQYQITSDEAGTAVVRSWTSTPGTVARGQFVRVRSASALAPGGTATITLTIDRGAGNGGAQSAQVVYQAA